MTTPKFDSLDCPVCSGVLERVPVLGYKLLRCVNCGELVQELGARPDGGSVLSPIGQLLKRNELGDDRVRAALSVPHVSSVKSFIEIYEGLTRMFQLDLASSQGGLRTVLAQMENRLDFAISQLAGLDLVSDQIAVALSSLREVRDLVSTMPSRNRGIPQRNTDGGTPE